MWKLEHAEGQREINELHVPVGRDVRLIMTSQDVIHSFYIPAFRIKQDVLPGRYTVEWFRATKPGVYHLFCAEYCGTQHSGMVGDIVVQEPAQYEAWMNGGSICKEFSASRFSLRMDAPSPPTRTIFANASSIRAPGG
jgi:cytochrome c oxidase subunit 2